MESFVLIINGWKPLNIAKKNLYINVYIVSIYIFILSNVDKINTPTSKNNSDATLKNYVLSVLWV